MAVWRIVSLEKLFTVMASVFPLGEFNDRRDSREQEIREQAAPVKDAMNLNILVLQ